MDSLFCVANIRPNWVLYIFRCSLPVFFNVAIFPFIIITILFFWRRLCERSWLFCELDMRTYCETIFSNVMPSFTILNYHLDVICAKGVKLTFIQIWNGTIFILFVKRSFMDLKSSSSMRYILRIIVYVEYYSTNFCTNGNRNQKTFRNMEI